ncbi:MAG: ABA4-like family protein [Pseudomonadota bacterium]
MSPTTPEMAFNLANPTALLGWIVLIVWLFLPAAWQRRSRYVGLALPLALSLLYAAAVGVYFSDSVGGFDSLENVMLLFTQPGMVLAGWVHYLAFDLFVGWCIAQDAVQRRVSRWFVVPCFAFTFMLGPVGLLLYTAARVATQINTHPTEAAA